VLLLSREVSPIAAQVCILDSECQFYPSWDSGEEPVAYRTFGLVDPDNPPYPGFAVATRPDLGPPPCGPVVVAVLRDEVPPDLTLIHSSVLYVGDHGVDVGNEQSGLTGVDLPRGCWPLQIWTDSTTTAEVGRVTFVVSTP